MTTTSTYHNTLVEQLGQEIDQTPTEHLRALLEIVRLFRQSITLPPASESFRQGWREVLAGETLPVAELWNDFEKQGK